MSNQRPLVSLLLELRCVVGALGEAHQWWRSTFLSTTGLSFLQRVYPRTWVAAAVRSSSEVARLEHDARIGRGQVVHLFRLPSALERALDDALSDWDAADQAKCRAMVVAPDGPLRVLQELAAGQKLGKSEGPVNCGPASLLADLSTVGALAAQYLNGFEAGRRVYPYLAMEGPR